MLPFFAMEETLELESPQVGERRDVSLNTQIRQSKKDEEVFSFIISKEEEDRHESIVVVNGIDTSHFSRNPVVLFNHNYDKVIGTAFNIRVVGDTLQADMRFAQTEFAQEIKGQVQRGEIRATSIGFIVNEWSIDEENDTWKIQRSELLEFSIVTVPSNRSALIMRDAKKIDSMESSIAKMATVVEKLCDTVQQLATPKINIDGRDLSAAIKSTDQSDQQATNETSTRDEADELAETDESVPDEAKEAKADEAENDPSHDTSESNGDTQIVTNNYQMTFEQAWELSRKVARRRLGKE